MTGCLGAVAAGVVVLGLTAPHAVQAQTYPTRPVTIIVPTTAGGGTDIIAEIAKWADVVKRAGVTVQ